MLGGVANWFGAGEASGWADATVLVWDFPMRVVKLKKLN